MGKSVLADTLMKRIDRCAIKFITYIKFIERVSIILELYDQILTPEKRI